MQTIACFNHWIAQIWLRNGRYGKERSRSTLYMIANNKMEEAEQQKIATFLWLIGPDAGNIFNILFPNDGTTESMFGSAVVEGEAVVNANASADGDNEQQENNDDEGEKNDDDDASAIEDVEVLVARTLDIVIKAFDDYCLPRKNIAMESFKFNTITQKEKQIFADFETELRTQLRYCEYNCKCGVTYEHRMLRDRIIIGVHDKKLQLKLLDGKDTPLKKVIETCKVYEAANANKNLLDRRTILASVNAVSETVSDAENQATCNAVSRHCFNCGAPFTPSHLRACKANDVNCANCGRKGHFAIFCRQKGKGKMDGQSNHGQSNGNQKKDNNNNGSSNNNNKKQTHSLHWNDEGNCSSLTLVGGNISKLRKNCVFRLNSNTCGSRIKWTKSYRINNGSFTFKIDTGSDVNCIPIKFIKKFDLSFANAQNNFVVLDYNSNKVNIHGTVKLKCFDAERQRKNSPEFLIVDDALEPLLGLATSIEFGLIKRLNAVQSLPRMPMEKEEFIKKFENVFRGIGKFPGTCSIKLKDDAVHSLHYKKRIPLSLGERLKTELDAMVKIISPVDYPTDWVNNVQIVEKSDDKLRICLDPKPLNACIKREHFLIPTIEDVMGRLANKSVFTVLDLSNGFWHMEL